MAATASISGRISYTRSVPRAKPDAAASAKRVATIIYALQALAFLYGITGIIALILGYAKRDDAADTWVESHFNWQINTFWWVIAWWVATVVPGMLLAYSSGEEGEVFTISVVVVISLIVSAIWHIYRVARGWLRLSEEEAIY